MEEEKVNKLIQKFEINSQIRKSSKTHNIYFHANPKPLKLLFAKIQ